MPEVTVNGATLSYAQLMPADGQFEGDVVMVHGLATNMAFWYFPYAVNLAERYRVTLFDLRGHARSTMTNSGYTPTALGHDLEALLEHLRIDWAHLVAHSFGGVVALSYAAKHPERVASLSLLDTQTSFARRALVNRHWKQGDVLEALFARHGLQVDAQDPYFGYHLLTVVARLLCEDRAIPPELSQLVSPMLGKYGARTAKQWLRLVTTTLAEQELRTDDGLSAEVLSQMRFPILAAFGERSQAFLTHDCLKGVWPHARFQTIEGAGHFFPTSHVGETLAMCHSFWGRDDSIIVPRSEDGRVGELALGLAAR